MLTRSLQRIFNPIRYAGNNIILHEGVYRKNNKIDRTNKMEEKRMKTYEKFNAAKSAENIKTYELVSYYDLVSSSKILNKKILKEYILNSKSIHKLKFRNYVTNGLSLF